MVLAARNGLARVSLGAHNPLDVVGGAAIGLAIAAVLDMILDVARDRGRPLWQHGPAHEDRGCRLPGRSTATGSEYGGAWRGRPAGARACHSRP